MRGSLPPCLQALSAPLKGGPGGAAGRPRYGNRGAACPGRFWRVPHARSLSQQPSSRSFSIAEPRPPAVQSHLAAPRTFGVGQQGFAFLGRRHGNTSNRTAYHRPWRWPKKATALAPKRGLLAA